MALKNQALVDLARKTVEIKGMATKKTVELREFNAEIFVLMQ